MAEPAAFVSGAARGIGLAIARELAERGHPVALGDLRPAAARREAARLQREGREAVAVPLDVQDPRSVRQAVRAAEAALGPLGVLVSNAGWDRLVPFVQTTERLWQRLIDLNFTGALRLTKEVLPGMVDRRFGRIVFISSDAARVGSSLESVYAGAKAGLVGFAKTIAREHAKDGITVNVVCPGPTRTPLLEGMQREGGERLVAALERAIPLGRLADPEEVAYAVSFFVSPRAAYITGQTLSVSGGLTMA